MRKPIKNLYHYTSEANAYKIIESCEIWFRKRQLLDEGLEEEQLQKRLSALNDIWGQQSQFASLFKSLINDTPTYIACFCEDSNNPYLWSGYGKRSVQFDAAQLGKIRDQGIIVGLDIEYLDFSEWLEKVRPLANNLVNSVARNLYEEIETNFLNSPVKESIITLYNSLLQTKERQHEQQQYEHEREVRFIINSQMCCSSEFVQEVPGRPDLKALQLHYSVFTKLLTVDRVEHPIKYYDPV